jgi:hypothetical protein
MRVSVCSLKAPCESPHLQRALPVPQTLLCGLCVEGIWWECQSVCMDGMWGVRRVGVGVGVGVRVEWGVSVGMGVGVGVCCA